MRQTCRGRLNVAPIVGLGALAFSQGRHEQALALCAPAMRRCCRITAAPFRRQLQ